ncbi:MAG: universal stress protein [Methanobacterium sp.]|uniref:universal stress protein n=1 Tax=Methanobacterium sp. TaxID=2164 RepID=UPI003D659840|nr:universal stress protein [Methanobacterium sp.]
MQKILLPIDGSENSMRAGEYAISMVDLNGADIIVLYVIDTSYLDALPQQDLRDKMSEELRKEGEIAVEEFKSKLEESQCQGHCKNVNLITKIKWGKPADVILKTIDEVGVDQVTMGKSGKQGIEKLILGSTADRVVRGSKVSVNVIS